MTNVNPGLIIRGCPFCGRIPQIKAYRFGMENAYRYGVVCHDCAICIGWETDEVKAIERWNRRAGDGMHKAELSHASGDNNGQMRG